MQISTIELRHTAPGTRQSLRVLHYGEPGQGPKVYIQAALHADEVPAMLVAHQLARQLLSLEKAGAITGEIVLVPCANPIGMGQMVLGQHQGRFDLRDGSNFNRGYAELATRVADTLRPLLTHDRDLNTALARTALVHAATELVAVTPTQDLKIKLLRLALEADIVLDLHCDNDAVMHVYALTPQSAIAQELGAALGARAILLATESGDSPFDEACTRTWLQLQTLLPQFPIDLACFGATVELRGETDTDHTLAEHDAQGICDFLAGRGVLAGPGNPVRPPQCEPTPLAGSEPVVAPHGGVVVFHRKPGDSVAAGDLVADLVDPLSGDVTPLRCKSAGLLYARSRLRWASAGEVLAKIAGTTLARTGKLLSP